MVVLRHETWAFANSLASGVAGHGTHAASLEISGPGELRRVYYASTHEERCRNTTIRRDGADTSQCSV